MNSSYEVFNLSRPTIKIGNEAKISMFDPTEKYIFSKKNIYSSSKMYQQGLKYFGVGR